jgi:hypothetical protein
MKGEYARIYREVAVVSLKVLLQHSPLKANENDE